MIELPPPLVLAAPAILRPCEIERQNPRLFELYLELRGYDPDWLRLAIASMPGFRTPHVAYDAPGSVSKTSTGAWSHTVPNFETSLVGTFIGAGAGGGAVVNEALSNGANGGATTCTGGISAGGGNGGINAFTTGAQGVSGSGGTASGGTPTNGQAGGVVAAGTNKGGDAPGGGAGGAAPSSDIAPGNAGSAAGGGGSGARVHFISRYGGGGGSGSRVAKTWLRGELTPGASLSGNVGAGGVGGGVSEGAPAYGGEGARGQADLVWT